MKYLHGSAVPCWEHGGIDRITYIFTMIKTGGTNTGILIALQRIDLVVSLGLYLIISTFVIFPLIPYSSFLWQIWYLDTGAHSYNLVLKAWRILEVTKKISEKSFNLFKQVLTLRIHPINTSILDQTEYISPVTVPVLSVNPFAIKL